MKRSALKVAAAVLVTSVSLFAQAKSAVQFYDTLGNKETAKIGWSGFEDKGRFFIQVPGIGEVILANKDSLFSNVTVFAPSFQGDGSKLTGIKSKVDDVLGLNDSLKGKATSGHTHNFVKSVTAATGAGITVTGTDAVSLQLSGIKTAHISDGAITKDKISATDVGDGKALFATSNGLAWKAPASSGGTLTSVTGVDGITATTTGSSVEIKPDYAKIEKVGHTHNNYLTSSSNIDAGKVMNKLDSARIPDLSALKLKFGKVDIARLPTGTSSSTVALGDHWHSDFANSSHSHSLTDISYFTKTVDNAFSFNTRLELKHQLIFRDWENSATSKFVFWSNPNALHLARTDASGNMVNGGDDVIFWVNHDTRLTEFWGPVKFNANVIAQSDQVQFTSDSTKKENFKPINSALDNISKINTYWYNWKTDTAKSYHTGFIAQELENIYPEFVKKDLDGFKSVSYIEMIPVLTQGIKDLVVENNKQRELLNNQNDEIAELKNEIEKIKEFIGMQ